MCLIAYSRDGALIERRVFDYARSVNSDGIGVMSALGVEKFVGRKHGKRAWRYLRQLAAAGVPYGLHFRWATHGDVTRANCHPFNAPHSDAVVMHNGVIPQTAKHATRDKSDTVLFVERFMTGAPAPRQLEYGGFFARIEKFLGWDNKLLVFHRSTNSFTVCNEDQGEWIDGFWYSNDYSLPDDMSRWQKYLTNLKPRRVESLSLNGSLVYDVLKASLPGREYEDRNVSDAMHRNALDYYTGLEDEPGYYDDGADVGTRAAMRQVLEPSYEPDEEDDGSPDDGPDYRADDEPASRDYLARFQAAVLADGRARAETVDEAA